ncbi:MAG TPA: M28 family peptidase [Gemmatimonadaceae bacterium]|nr:M28 family peptidase [Gemmatimonadaceae bacterium]
MPARHALPAIRTLAAFALTTLLAAPAAAQGGTRARASQKPVWPDEGPMTWTPRPTSPEITASDLRTRLYGFADDSMQGRRMGELGNYKGTTYIAGEFQRMGLKPAGDGGTFFQTVQYGPIGFDSAASRLVIAGRAAVAGRDWVPLRPNGSSGIGGTADLSGVPVVFGGRYGDSAPLDPAVYRGKVVVLLGGPAALARFGRGATTPPSCDSVPNHFGAEAVIADSAAMSRRRGRGRGAFTRTPPDTRAATAGAVAVLYVNLDDSSDAAAGAFTQRSIMRPTPEPAGTPAGASITRATAERIFGRQVDQLAAGATGRPVSARWDYAWHLAQWPARNVVAVMPGSDPARAGEYILISAHNDHIGVNNHPVDHDSLRAVNTVTRRQGANDPVCRPNASQQHRIDSIIARARSIRPPRLDSINNGADDDGSGTVILLEIAEQFSREHPARSIIFVSHTGEEEGLYGSEWFTAHPTIPLDSVVAALNMDMEAKGRVDQVMFGGPTSIQILGARRLSREFGDIIDSVNAVRTPVMAIDRSWDVPANPLNRFCRSDQVNYVLHDIPTAYFSTGYAQDYHQVTDEPQYADYDHMAAIGGFVHQIAMAVATRADKPSIAGNDPRYPTCR